MNVLINHCWCSDSNWGGLYSCRTIVSLEQFKDEDCVWDSKPTEDWTNLIEEHDFFDQRRYEILKKKNKYSEEDLQNLSMETTNRLRPEVLKWLNKNVKDRKDEKNTKGWCVGSDAYNARDSISFSIFFHRQTDAMKFIKTWSSYKNPLVWFNYFDDVRKHLDLATNKLKRV